MNKIVGPGNSYVTAAKKLVAFDCAIDFLAGPTEAVDCERGGRSEFMAADLVSQAEHDPETLGICYHDIARVRDDVKGDLGATGKRKSNRAKVLATRRILGGGVALAGQDWANRIALNTSLLTDHLPFIRNAGSIFVGDYSAQAAGDYASGPNHVLPTSGQARFRGGFSVLDFLKVITIQKLSPRDSADRDNSRMSCAAEGLPAHGRSMRVRCEHA